MANVSEQKEKAALRVACPYCEAGVGMKCTTDPRTGGAPELRKAHRARIKKADEMGLFDDIRSGDEYQESKQRAEQFKNRLRGGFGLEDDL